MRFLLIISFFTVLFTNPFESVREKEARSSVVVVSWKKNRNLTWSDFKGVPKAGSPYAAECYWEIKYSYSYNPHKNKLSFDVLCYFNSSKSWVKAAERSEGLLQHEQMHFDIAEYCSRKLRKNLSATKFQKASFKTDINEIFEHTLEECDSLQRVYDEDTNHGLNKKQQNIWIANVNKDLSNLESFEYTPNLETTLVDDNFIAKLFRKLSL